jgi:predicted aldo/keto reductase-like oxidoreductase
VYGFGGVLVMNEPQENVNRLVAQMFERGINYFDVAPQYGDAEERLGPALQPYREQCFLACKTLHRTAEQAEAQFECSLRRLQTDRLDLYQLHALNDMTKDVDVAFGRGGVIELVDRARREGRIRHAGFSAHSVEAAEAAMDRYDFDSILVPVNFAAFFVGDFGPSIIEKAAGKGLSVLALKAMARQKWAEGDPVRQRLPKAWYKPILDPTEAALSLRFTLSRPGVVAAVGPGEIEPFRTGLEVIESGEALRPPDESELQTLRRLAEAEIANPVFSASGPQRQTRVGRKPGEH